MDETEIQGTLAEMPLAKAVRNNYTESGSHGLKHVR